METHAGWGALYKHCYSTCRGVAIEKSQQKAVALAKQRPTWAIYEGDCERAILEGVGFWFEPNFFDVDPYGEPWPIVDAILTNELPAYFGIVVNDGLRQKLKMQGGWSVGSMSEWVQRYGNAALYPNYKEVCQQIMKEKAESKGFRLERWASYYCGYKGQMTHYAGIFVKNP